MNGSAEWKGTLGAYDRIKQAQEAIAKVLPVYNYYEKFRGQPQASISSAPRILQHPLSICAPALRARGRKVEAQRRTFP